MTIKTSDLVLKDLGCHEAIILLREWDWLTAGRYEPVVVTAFGDWFLEHLEDGSIHFLDAGMGTLKRVASSRQSWRKKIPNQRQAWLLAGQYEQLCEQGERLGPGECFGWRIVPCLGGSLDPDNFEVTSLGVHQLVCSRMAERFAHLPAGTQITESMIGEVLETLSDEVDPAEEREHSAFMLVSAAAVLLVILFFSSW